MIAQNKCTDGEHIAANIVNHPKVRRIITFSITNDEQCTEFILFVLGFTNIGGGNTTDGGFRQEANLSARTLKDYIPYRDENYPNVRRVGWLYNTVVANRSDRLLWTSRSLQGVHA
jgi:hypothetical protein